MATNYAATDQQTQSIITSVERPASAASQSSTSSQQKHSTTSTTTSIPSKLHQIMKQQNGNDDNSSSTAPKQKTVTHTINIMTTTTSGSINKINTPQSNQETSASKSDSAIISQLQQLQSPPPHTIVTNTAKTAVTSNTTSASEAAATNTMAAAPTATTTTTITTTSRANETQTSRDASSPITQVTKSRHRGFISQLLCCFRPTSHEIYQDSNGIFNNADIHCNSLTSQKYSGKYLLPARKPSDNRICLVIDLDETLVHSSFKPIGDADFTVPVEIDGTLHQVYVLKRPYVDEFLRKVGQKFECVLFTASLAKYADPVANLLDTNNIFKARLFRESCAFYRGNYVKDLSRLGRDLNRVIIVDNSPASYIFHPDNAVSTLSIITTKLS